MQCSGEVHVAETSATCPRNTVTITIIDMNSFISRKLNWWHVWHWTRVALDKVCKKTLDGVEPRLSEDLRSSTRIVL
jgi:hypothetical protein